MKLNLCLTLFFLLTTLISRGWGTLSEHESIEEKILKHAPEMIWRTQAHRFSQPVPNIYQDPDDNQEEGVPTPYKTDYNPELENFKKISIEGPYSQKIVLEELKKTHYDLLEISAFLARRIEEASENFGGSASFIVSIQERELIEKQKHLEDFIVKLQNQWRTSEEIKSKEDYLEKRKAYEAVYDNSLRELQSKAPLNLAQQKVYKDVKENYECRKSYYKYEDEKKTIYLLYELLLKRNVEAEVKNAFQRTYGKLLEPFLLYPSIPEGLFGEELRIFSKYNLELKKAFIQKKLSEIGTIPVSLSSGELLSPPLKSYNFYSTYRDKLAGYLFEEQNFKLGEGEFVRLMNAFDEDWNFHFSLFFVEYTSPFFKEPAKKYKSPLDLYKVFFRKV